MMQEEFINEMKRLHTDLPSVFNQKVLEVSMENINKPCGGCCKTAYEMVEFIYTFSPRYDLYNNAKTAIAAWYMLSSFQDVIDMYNRVVKYHKALEDVDTARNLADSLGGLLKI